VQKGHPLKKSRNLSGVSAHTISTISSKVFENSEIVLDDDSGLIDDFNTTAEYEIKYFGFRETLKMLFLQ
jgi:hypothetical protein